MTEINVKNLDRRRSGRSKFKLSTRIDLTPMVDLGFLLITFFVFTTSMAESKTLNIVSRIEVDAQAIPASGTMTIIVGGNRHLYYYYGLLDKTRISEPLHTADFKKIRTSMLQQKLDTEIGKLMLRQAQILFLL